jgi:ATP-dependent Lhr-like helicase
MAPDAQQSLEYHVLPCSAENALATLSEPVSSWFRQHLGEPTTAQRLAWPVLASGKNLLLAAPTGSGKTLAAFLPILDRLLTAPLAMSVRCLYLTPLKALGNDARANLRAHLDGIRAFLPDHAASLSVGLRTGDTSARSRRQLLLEPPDILLTTPESLAVLLTQAPARELFSGLRWVIVDEVHALAPSKRGADLSLSLERLEALVGGPELNGTSLQRIGLSATCSPLETAARFLVGANRTCTIARVAEEAPLQLAIEPLSDVEERTFVGRLVSRLEPELTAHRTTLVFTNVRSLAERLAWALRRRFPDWAGQIAVHHSSLAASRRRAVERGLKEGSLRAVISSTSLELGIDIGSVKSVVLVHPPGGVVRLLQRVGRGGHGPGRPRRGLVLTATAAELLEAAVTAASGRSAQYEPLRLPSCPLDVLCQQLLGMATERCWSPQEAFDLVRRAAPYQALSRSDFDDCLHYLSGRHCDGRTWLPARLHWDEQRFTIAGDQMTRLLRRNIGTILTGESRTVRLVGPDDDGGDAVGEIEETFADRLQPGDRFLLDGRCLEYRRLQKRALLVEEVVGRPAVPRWNSDVWPLTTELARRLYLLRIHAAETLRDGPHALANLLRRDYGLAARAALELVEFFQQQECVSEIPDALTCLVEVVPSGNGADHYIHTPLNRAGNDALARVIVRRLVREEGRSATSMVADLGLLLSVAGAPLTLGELRVLLVAMNFEEDLEQALAGSSTVRDYFRRAALTGLMLLRNPIGRRRRVGGIDWAERRLFEQVAVADPDFVLLRQALREIRETVCDAQAARRFLEDFPGLTLRLRRLQEVSPFARSWTQLALGPVETVTSPAEALQRLHAALLLPADPDRATD